ncbi:MAG: nitroreductase family protein [Acidisphaera sp.]|nr:nitroreductase family protein [Acidisphaera sp.]
MDEVAAPIPRHYDEVLDVVRRRRSVRRFEKGRSVPRQTLLRIAEFGRWAPTGANAQCWDLVIVDEPAMRQQVLDVFLRQSQRLVEHAKGFPAVRKAYLANTVAIFLLIGDPRWKRCFPQGTTAESAAEYAANNERIYLASLGAAIQNVQLGVTAVGLTSAWLSGGGERTTNTELQALLGYPPYMEAIGTIPVGYPEKDVGLRYRRPLEQLVHWNGYRASQHRPDEMIDFYIKELRPFAMYRGTENLLDWQDADAKLGAWKSAFTAATATGNPR